MDRRITTSIGVLALTLMWGGAASAQMGGALKRLGKKAIEKAGEPKPEPSTDAKPEEPESKQPDPSTADTAGPPAKDDSAAAATAEPDYKAYQNYDFVPGEKIVFDDDFTADADGEFPAHWKLVKAAGRRQQAAG